MEREEEELCAHTLVDLHVSVKTCKRCVMWTKIYRRVVTVLYRLGDFL